MDFFTIKNPSLIHLFKVMKITLFLLFLCTFSAFAVDAHSQNARVTIHKVQVPLEDILNEIESQTDYLFLYTNEIDVDKKATVKVKSQPVSQLLNGLLAKSGITYQMEGTHIILSEKKVEEHQALPDKIKVTGTVKDANGEVIIGASVVEENTTNGTITDISGNFVLTVSDNAVIKISYIGYVAQQVKAVQGKPLNIVLREDTKTLDEVVVVGYGVQKKRDLTGAISSVKMNDTPVGTVASISHALAGKAAGLQVNTVSAQPGGGASFRIRGAASPLAGNDPLIIVDGFPVSDPGNLSVGKYSDGTKDNILASINPSDIESIEVLKDASSTAIYGARAGNGVIIVTTKKGASGAPAVKYSASASIQKMANQYDVLDATDFMKQVNRYTYEVWMKDNKIGIYGGNPESGAPAYAPRYTDDVVNNPTHQTDWMDLVTRIGFQTQHNISINGGSDYTKYLVSGNYFKQNGVLRNNGLERFTGRINLEHKLSKYVKTGVNLTLSRSNYDNVPLDARQSENAGILVSASQFNPTLPVKDENGEYTLNEYAAYTPNPVSLLEITDKTTKERVLGTVFVDIEPIKDLHLKANLGIDRNYEKRKTYLPTTTLYGQKEGGKADIGQMDKSDYLLELTASYNKAFKQHTFALLGGYSFQSFNKEYVNAGNGQFLTDGFLYNNLEAGANPKPYVGSGAEKDEMASFFGRVNYSYMDRYLISATFRADGASNFSENNKWGYFPSVALGWRFIDEKFMSPLTGILSNGKLRLSYGETGNSNIGNKAISYYQVGNNNTFGDNEAKGVYLSQLGNTDLRWETTREYNIGIDLGFLNNRINVTAEYFSKTVSDLLSTRDLLSLYEVESITANIGKTQSRGVELSISTRNIDRSDLVWTTDFNFSFYRDKWKDRGPYWKPSAYSIYNAPIRGDYGYVADGLIQVGEQVNHMPGSLPGQVKLQDIDGFEYNADGSIKVDENGRFIKTGKPDGNLDDADKVFYGNSDPGYLCGLNNTIRWKNFDLNIYFYGQFNVLTSGSYKDVWLTGEQQMNISRIGAAYNMPTTIKEVWSHDNQSSTRPGYFQNLSSWGVGDYFHEKSWFVRCRNITLGYTLPLKKGNSFISGMRIYADVNNPFIFTPYNGLDPETDNNRYAYPNVRSISFGFDISF